MKVFIKIIMVVTFTMCARGEMRKWTALSGTTIEAEYDKILFDNVILKDASGGELRIPLAEFSGEDLKYIELRNPPMLSVDFMKSANQEFVPSPPWGRNATPLTILIYQFGARVKQKAAQPYMHSFKVELYAFTQQRYDQDKYHLICRVESEPFMLSKANDRRYEFTDPKKYTVYSYDFVVDFLNWREKRGEKFAESLILVRDERGEIITYNTTKNWLYNNLDKLEKLPIGAWLNNNCDRVHPTMPKSTKNPSR